MSLEQNKNEPLGTEKTATSPMVAGNDHVQIGRFRIEPQFGSLMDMSDLGEQFTSTSMINHWPPSPELEQRLRILLSRMDRVTADSGVQFGTNITLANGQMGVLGVHDEGVAVDLSMLPGAGLLSADQFEHILHHEAAHIKYGDTKLHQRVGGNLAIANYLFERLPAFYAEDKERFLALVIRDFGSVEKFKEVMHRCSEQARQSLDLWRQHSNNLAGDEISILNDMYGPQRTAEIIRSMPEVTPEQLVTSTLELSMTFEQQFPSTFKQMAENAERMGMKLPDMYSAAPQINTSANKAEDRVALDTLMQKDVLPYRDVASNLRNYTGAYVRAAEYRADDHAVLHSRNPQGYVDSLSMLGDMMDAARGDESGGVPTDASHPAIPDRIQRSAALLTEANRSNVRDVSSLHARITSTPAPHNVIGGADSMAIGVRGVGYNPEEFDDIRSLGNNRRASGSDGAGGRHINSITGENYDPAQNLRWFMDGNRIIDPESPEAIDYTKQMDGLTRRLLGDRYDLRTPPRFFLADDPTINAYTIPRHHPPIIVLNKGLIAQAGSLDEIAGVISHELGHILAKQEFNTMQNSKAEEMAADVYAVKLLAEAGFDAQGLENLLARIERGDPSQVSKIITAMSDVHPLSDNRSSTMEKARIALNREGFSTSAESTPVPERLLHVTQDVQFLSSTDIRAQARASSFDQMPSSEQLSWLVQRVDETRTIPAHSIGRDAIGLYVSQITDLLSDIPIDPKDPVVREQLVDTFNHMIETGLWNHESPFLRLYETTLGHLGESTNRPYKPIGVFADINAELQGFVNAETYSDALAHAEKMMEIHPRIPSRRTKDGMHLEKPVTVHVNFGQVTYESKAAIAEKLKNGAVEVPLLRHYEWFENSKDEAFAQAMKLAINESGDRNYSGLAHLMKVEFTNGFYSLKEYTRDFIHQNGRITSTIPDPVSFPNQYEYERNEYERGNKIPVTDGNRVLEHHELALAKERAYLGARRAWEQQILDDGVPWGMLKNDTERFMRIYGAATEPLRTYKPYDAPFATAMMQQVQQWPMNDVSDLTQRTKLLEMLVKPVNKLNFSFALPGNKQLLQGLDVDHPYVQEYQRLDAIESNAPEEWVTDDRFHPVIDDVLKPLRINPLEGATNLTITREQSGLRNPVRDAYLVDEIMAREITPPSVDQLPRLVKDYERLFEITMAHAEDEETKKVAAELKEKLGSQIRKTFEATSALDTQQLMKWYTELDRHHELDGLPDVKEKWASAILDRIAALEPAERETAFLKLLNYIPENKWAGYRENGNFIAPTPTIRRRLTGMIVDHLANELGADDTTQEYAERVASRLDKYQKASTGSIRTDIISGVAEAVESQPELTAKLRRRWLNNGAAEAISQDVAARISEAALEHIKVNPEKRAALLEFLSTPLSPESVSRTHHILTNGQDDLLGGRALHRNIEKERFALRDFHTDFWEMPMAARAVLLNDNLFPTNMDAKVAEHVSQRVLGRMLGESDGPIRVNDLLTMREHLAPFAAELAETDTNYGKKGNDHTSTILGQEYRRSQLPAAMGMVAMQHIADDARTNINNFRNQFGLLPDRSATATSQQTVSSYLSAVADQDPAEARLLIAALMGADQRRKGGEPLRLGQTLRLVLSQMGPAGTKLLQAIHSHPSTPEDIRADLSSQSSDTKTNHNRPLRWDAIDLLDNAGLLDTEHPNRVTRVGPVIGAASFGITFRNETADGQQYADTMLRPRSLAKSLREFDLMMDASRILTNRDPRMLPVLDMISEAEQSARIETSMSLAAKQNDLAMQAYHGISVTVDNGDGTSHTFRHQVTDMHEHGPEHKRVSLARGPHFNDLPADTIGYRRAAAYSVAATQLSLRLAGIPVDRDRHGGNVKIDGDTIRHFDFGMMDLAPPNEAQKQALGKVLAQAMKDSRNAEGEFTNNLVRRIDSLQAHPAVKDFLSGFKREVLALGDYFNAVSSEGHSGRVFTGILGQGLLGDHADATIQQAFRKEMGIFTGTAEQKLRTAIAESPVQISGMPNPQTLRLPTLTAEEQAIASSSRARVPVHLATMRNAIQSGANNGFGVAMGGYALYEKFASDESYYHQDLKSGDTGRIAASHTSVGLDVAMISTSGIATAADASIVRAHRKVNKPVPVRTPPNGIQEVAKELVDDAAKAVTESVDDVVKVAAESADDAAKAATAGATGAQAGGGSAALRMAGRISTRAMIPLAVAAGGVQTYAAVREGNRERAASAVGGTIGGILGGIAVGAGAGALMGGTAGSVVPGVGTIVVGVVAGVAGGIGGAIIGEEGARRYASSAMGWLTGVDGKFEKAMKGLDPRLQAFIDQNGDHKRDVEDVHLILKRAGLDSIDKIDKNHDGKLSSGELNAALAGVIINKELGEKLAEANAKGWGKSLGNKDGKLTLDELKAALPKGLDLLSLDKNHNGDISGREISDALNAARNAAAATIPPKPKAAPTTQRH